MPTIDPNELLGRCVDGIFERPVHSDADFKSQLVLVRIRDLGLVPLDLAAPPHLPSLRVHEGPAGNSASDVVLESAIGQRIVDVIASEYLASISLVLENGRIITNDVSDYGNFAAVMPADAMPLRGEYVSLSKTPS